MATATAATGVMSAVARATARPIATSMMTTTVATATAATVVMSAVARATATTAAASAAEKAGRGVAAEHGEANNREENRNSKHNKSVHSGILQ